MTIKQMGGIFGRNPTFNDVTIEGQLTFDGDIDINSDLSVDGDLDVTGSVGIGTSNPAYNLVVSNNGAEGLEIGPGYAGGRNLFQNYNRGISQYVAAWNYASEYLYYIGGSRALHIDTSRNTLINGSQSPASAVGSLAIFNGTAPTGSVANGIVLYAEDVSASSELKVRDEAGNVTVLSPHNFSLIPEGASEEMAFSYYSTKDCDVVETEVDDETLSVTKTIKKINVDMLKALRLLESLTGETLVYQEQEEITYSCEKPSDPEDEAHPISELLGEN
jgi:hypothetical protein